MTATSGASASGRSGPSTAASQMLRKTASPPKPIVTAPRCLPCPATAVSPGSVGPSGPASATSGSCGPTTATGPCCRSADDIPAVASPQVSSIFSANSAAVASLNPRPTTLMCSAATRHSATAAAVAAVASIASACSGTAASASPNGRRVDASDSTTTASANSCVVYVFVAGTASSGPACVATTMSAAAAS